MLPVIYRFDFHTPLAKVILYLIALALPVYLAWSGWHNATGRDAQGNPTDPSPQDRSNRAVTYGVLGIVAAVFGLYYALPEVPLLGKGKGEGLPIHTYGILVGSGFITAVTVSAWLAMREWPGDLGIKRRDQIFDLAFYLFIGAMVGSRVLFIIVNWSDYSAHPSKMLELGGGLVQQGGLIGASLTAYWYAKKNGIEFLRLSDIAMPTVSLGITLGRLGCFSAGCCWGKVNTTGGISVSFPGQDAKDLLGNVTNTPSLAWSSMHDSSRWVDLTTGIQTEQAVPGATRVADWVNTHGHTLPLHPTQLYESLAHLSVFVLLMSFRRYRRFHGQILGMWLIIAAVIRTSVELLRGDAERGTIHGFLIEKLGASWGDVVPLSAWYNVSTGQTISLLMFSLGTWVLVSRLRVFRAQQPVQVAAA